MGKPDVPPPPDMTEVYKALNRQIDMFEDISEKALEFNKDQFAWSKDVTQQVLDIMLPSQKFQFDQAVESWNLYKELTVPRMRQMGEITDELLASGLIQEMGSIQTQLMRDNYAQAKAVEQQYWTQFKPLEDELVQKAQTFSTKGRRDLEAGKRIADVTSQFGAAERETERSLAGYGIDPSSGRGRAIGAAMDIGQATAGAAAASQGRQYVEDKADQYLGAAIGLGQGKLGAAQGLGTAATTQGQGALATERLPIGDLARVINPNLAGQSTAQFAGSGQAGTGAMAGAQGQFGVGTQGWGPGISALGGAMTGAGTMGNLQQQNYANQIASYRAESANNPMASIMGLLGGGMRMFMGASEGGAIPEFGTDPSGKLDNIPAQVSEGEYVVPTEVVRFKGTEFFDKLIEKSQQTPKREAKMMGANQGGQVAQIGQHPMGYQWSPEQPLNSPTQIGQPGEQNPFGTPQMGMQAGGPVPPYGAPAGVAPGQPGQDTQQQIGQTLNTLNTPTAPQDFQADPGTQWRGLTAPDPLSPSLVGPTPEGPVNYGAPTPPSPAIPPSMPPPPMYPAQPPGLVPGGGTSMQYGQQQNPQIARLNFMQQLQGMGLNVVEVEREMDKYDQGLARQGRTDEAQRLAAEQQQQQRHAEYQKLLREWMQSQRKPWQPGGQEEKAPPDPNAEYNEEMLRELGVERELRDVMSRKMLGEYSQPGGEGTEIQQIIDLVQGSGGKMPIKFVLNNRQARSHIEDFIMGADEELRDEYITALREGDMHPDVKEELDKYARKRMEELQGGYVSAIRGASSPHENMYQAIGGRRPEAMPGMLQPMRGGAYSNVRQLEQQSAQARAAQEAYLGWSAANT